MTRKIYFGSANPGVNNWEPGDLAEVAIVRSEGTSGNLQAGFWRTSPTSPGCRPDGSCLAAGPTPYHDAVVVLEGSGTVTIASTGTAVRIEPGVIISHPKGLDTRWDIDGPYLKKFFVEWIPSRPDEEPGDIYTGHVADNPDLWRASDSERAGEDNAGHGEYYLIREENTASDTLIVGIWRSRAPIGDQNPNLAPFSYDGAHGDTTLLLLEGRALLHNEETGESHEIMSGEVVGLPAGLRTSWSSLTPFVKAFFVVTREDPSCQPSA